VTEYGTEGSAQERRVKIIEKTPCEETLSRSVQSRKPQTIMFTDEGIVPNHP